MAKPRTLHPSQTANPNDAAAEVARLQAEADAALAKANAEAKATADADAAKANAAKDHAAFLEALATAGQTEAARAGIISTLAAFLPSELAKLATDDERSAATKEWEARIMAARLTVVFAAKVDVNKMIAIRSLPEKDRHTKAIADGLVPERFHNQAYDLFKKAYGNARTILTYARKEAGINSDGSPKEVETEDQRTARLATEKAAKEKAERDARQATFDTVLKTANAAEIVGALLRRPLIEVAMIVAAVSKRHLETSGQDAHVKGGLDGDQRDCLKALFADAVALAEYERAKAAKPATETPTEPVEPMGGELATTHAQITKAA